MKKDFWGDLLDAILVGILWLCVLALALIIVGLIGLRIYCLVVYGDTPINELPTWIAWLMFRR